MKTKTDELWPPYSSPHRIEYPDRPSLPEEFYVKARKHFTRKKFDEVRTALNPPRNFDLLKRLRHAVFDFWLYEAAREGKIDLLGAMPEGKIKADILDEFIRRTADYAEFCDAHAGVFITIAENAENWLALLSLLREFKRAAEARRQGIDLSKAGRPASALPRIVFQSHISLIYERAKKKQMTSRTPTDTSMTSEPYGPAFDFFYAAFRLIGQDYQPSTINKYLKDTIRKASKIRVSKHLQK